MFIEFIIFTIFYHLISDFYQNMPFFATIFNNFQIQKTIKINRFDLNVKKIKTHVATHFSTHEFVCFE